MFHICSCLTTFAYITYITDNDNLKPLCFTQYHKRLITYFATLTEESTGSELSNETALFTFLLF